MKKAIQNIVGKISIYSLCLFLLSSCGKKSDPAPVSTKPTIIGFSPASGLPGSTVIITGTNLGGSFTNVVKFGGIAVVTSETVVTPTTLTVKVPATSATGYITLEMNGEIVTSATEFVVPINITNFTPKGGIGGVVSIFGTGFSTIPANNIVKFNGVLAQVTDANNTNILVAVPVGATTGKISIQVGNGAGSIVQTATNFIVLPGSWVLKANFGGVARQEAFSFAIGTKGYLGGGKAVDSNTGVTTDLYDFWEYEPITNIWTQKANIGASLYTSSIGFAIGTKGYLVNDYVWEYDPSGNTWMQKNPFIGGVRTRAVSFAIGNKGYVGTGVISNTTRKDLWEYNPATDSWLQKADFGGGPTADASSFVIGTKGYISGKSSGFWEYNQLANTWAQKTNSPNPVGAAIGYSINNKGYITLGSNNYYSEDVFEYDPTTDAWTEKAPYGNFAKYAIAFVVGNKAYVGTGGGNFIGPGILTFKAIREFTP